jgi:heme a synthase
MVLVQVSIGGITRLTDSGLSMTTWEPVKGALPPLSEEAWQRAFDDYRRYPEFYKKNADFTLQEFKGIFWWEYIHRAWARLIGLVFLFPFLFFWRKGMISPRLARGLPVVVALGAAQALMGWVMVKSGMSESPWVSPYRLTAHLLLALGLLIMLLSLALEKRAAPAADRGLKPWLWALSALVLLQIAYGGLVAGSDAARHFNTWPTMNGQWVPSGLFAGGLVWETVRDNVISPRFIVNVQFLHRGLAVLVLAAALFFWWKGRGASSAPLRRGSALLLLAIGLQFGLGVATILLSGPAKIHLELGVLHQLGAFLLTGVLVYLHRNTAAA